jgi:hypothetical protein
MGYQMNKNWFYQNRGCEVFIDDYANLPTASIVALDLETNGKDGDDMEIVCVGISPMSHRHSFILIFDQS